MSGKNALREIFEIHLVHDADAGRHQTESLECLLPPFQKFVALAIPFELHLHVQTKRFRRPGEIDLHGVIDDEIDGHERLDDFRVAAQALHRAAHGREIHHERDAGEILQNNARDHEWNFFVRRRLRVPVRERFDIFAPHLFAIAISQHRFENDANAHRQPRDFADALFFERGERMQKSLAATSGVEFLQRLEFVAHSLCAIISAVKSVILSASEGSLIGDYGSVLVCVSNPRR